MLDINLALAGLLGGKRPASGSPREGDAPSRAAKDKDKKRLDFRPHSQEDLHRRLETYRPLWWFARPEPASAIECARHGWVNTGKDQLECEFCSALLRFPAGLPLEHRQAAANAFAPQLVSKHASWCPWRATPSQRTLLLYQPPAGDAERREALRCLELRQQRLLQVELLPELSTSVVSALMNVAGPAVFRKAVLLGRDIGLPSAGPVGRLCDGGGAAAVAAVQQAAGTFAAELAAVKLTNAERARMLALLGWEMEVLATGDGAARGAAAVARPDPSHYSLVHLTGAKPPPRQQAQQQARQPQQQQQRQWKVNTSSVVLMCPACKARVGLWNFSGPRPAPIGRVTAGGADAAASSSRLSGGGASPPASPSPYPGSQLPAGGAADGVPISAALSRTIAGGAFGSATVSAGGGPFGRPSGGEPVFGRPGRSSGQSGPPVTDSPAPAAAASGALKRGAPASSGGTFMEAGDAVAASSKRPCVAGPSSGGASSMAAAALSPLQAALGLLSPRRAPVTPPAPGAAAAAARESSGAVVPPASGPASGSALPASETFDALGYHRSWCPWVYAQPAGEADCEAAAAAGGREGGACGWMYLVRLVGDWQASEASACEAPPGGGSTRDVVMGIKDTLRKA